MQLSWGISENFLGKNLSIGNDDKDICASTPLAFGRLFSPAEVARREVMRQGDVLTGEGVV